MQIDNDFPGKLFLIGCIAGSFGEEELATTIIEGLQSWNPDGVEPLIGLAATKLGNGEVEEAVSIIQNRILPIQPDNSTAKCMLGIGLKLFGENSKAELLLEEAARMGSEDDKELVLAFQAQS